MDRTRASGVRGPGSIPGGSTNERSEFVIPSMHLKEVKAGNFASTSEFFRHLWRLWKAEQLSAEIRMSERDFSRGKFKVLKSLKDLR